MSEENGTKPSTASWGLTPYAQYRFNIINKNSEYKYIFAPENGGKAKMGPVWPDVGSFTQWDLVFSNSYNSVKIGHKGKYMKADKNSVALVDDDATIWNITMC